MENEDLKPTGETPDSEEKKSEIIVNDYGATKDSAVVIEEEDRTVLLTEDETLVISKDQSFDVPPKNRVRKVYGGMWGRAEIATVGLALLPVLASILVFALLVLPHQRELDNNRARRDELEKELLTARSRYGNMTSTQQRVNELALSVNDFETRFLRVDTIGLPDLYQRLNGLIGAYGLINTTGPDYAVLEIADQNRSQQSEKESGRSKFISIFPGRYVTMTVEGSYQNLRRFIREIETSNQFIVISAIELEPAEEREKRQQKEENSTQASVNNPQVNPIGPNVVQPVKVDGQRDQAKIDQGVKRGEIVSLRLEMAAYFRRPGFVPMDTSALEKK